VLKNPSSTPGSPEFFSIFFPLFSKFYNIFFYCVQKWSLNPLRLNIPICAALDKFQVFIKKLVHFLYNFIRDIQTSNFVDSIEWRDWLGRQAMGALTSTSVGSIPQHTPIFFRRSVLQTCRQIQNWPTSL
jgi:hypothetical protein